jgi:tRNA(Ile)-lysidine synthase
LPVAQLLALPQIIQKLVVRHALRECRGSLRGISMAHVLDVLTLCRAESSGHRIQLPGDALAIREFDNLILLGATPLATPEYRYELALPGKCEVPETGMVFHATIAEESPRDEPGPAIERAVLDAAALPNPLIIRSCLPGDRYGGAGHRKLKKIFNQARIPLRERSCLPVVVAGDAVVWMPGARPAKSFIARSGCGRCVVLEVRRILGRP